MRPREPGPRLGRPAGTQSDETQARILDAALECYATVGYSRATNALIAQHAGVTAANLYHYYACKADLFVAVGNAVARSVEAANAESVKGPPSLRGKLCALVESFAEAVTRNPRLGQFLVVWSLELDRQPELQAKRARFIEDTLRFYERLVDDAKVRGELPDDADPRGLAEGVQSILLGLSVLASRPKQGRPAVESGEAGTGESSLFVASRTLVAWLAGTYFGSTRRAIPRL